MWILNAILVHLLLLGSIFVIYFRSPVITGLHPQSPLTDFGFKPPAKRLVLFVLDGLRAESFFRNNCSDVPHIGELLLQQNGLAGLSHTRVPTESRPGHIALIAGLYEDPSAVLRGWKENPIDFDTLFNRSSVTYAWGANDVLHIFSRISDGAKSRFFADIYDHNLDFSGRNDTFALDEWVFERVRFVLKRKRDTLKHEEQMVFFLHLLGLDTAGHVHKPGTERFLENLHRTERSIAEIYREFEETFDHDGRTAYVLTSDHGMTDAGSHGAGAAFETETPFLLWGAGVVENAASSGKTFNVGTKATLPLYEVEQAQLTPLMAALVGLAPPMNNFGQLPLAFLNATEEYKAAAAHSNALQLLAQFRKLLDEHQEGLFGALLRRYEALDIKTIEAYKQSYADLIQLKAYTAAQQNSQHMMRLALEGIDYYHGYYRNTLLLSTTATFLGWMIYLLQLLVERETYAAICTHRTRMSTPILFFAATIALAFAHFQQVSFGVAFYMLVPFFVWMKALQQRYTLRSLWQHYRQHKLQLVLLVCCAELLVLSFFQRQVISFAFFIYALASNWWRKFVLRDYRFLLWVFLVLALIMFPLLPTTVGYKNDILLLLGMLFTLVRPLCVKTHLQKRFLVIGLAGIANALYCIYCHNKRIALPLISQFISWNYLVYTFAILLRNHTTALKTRLELIFFNLTTFYTFLCTSYEAIFIMLLALELLISLVARESYATPSIYHPSLPKNSAQQMQSTFRLAFAILLYTFFSFFGTGNIASVSSFDPNVIRCFLTTFQPFVIMALVILKLILPVILNISIIYGISDFARNNERQIFICLLLICDIMGLNFLFLVRNTGSWLDIGTSISHFVIMEVTTLVLLLLTLPAKLFLRLQNIAPLGLKIK